MSLLIGSDIGTLGTKTILTDCEGRILASSFREYGVLTPKPGWAEQWPDVWFNALCDTIKEVLEASKVDPKEVAAVSISGLYGGSGIPCDKEMKPLRPCIIWADRRATEECKWIRANIGEDRVFKVTGNTIDPYYGYTKMLWIKFNEPNIWSKIYQILTPNGYCIYKLTGSVALDFSSAGNYGGILDINKRSFAEQLMEELGIERRFFPEKLVESKQVVGEVHREASERTGLKTGTPICAGGIDAPVSALAVGALDDGDLALMLGTSMCCGFISHKPRISIKLINYPYVARDRELLYSFAGVSTAGYCIRWFRDQLGQTEVEAASKLKLSAYTLLDMEAIKVPPGSDGLIFMPHMMIGDRAPYWNEYIRGCLLGLTLYHTKAHIFRAFLEGVAYGLKYSVDVAIEAGMPIRRAILVDGGARSELWRTILADVSGLTMDYIAENPGAPLGDVVLAGVGVNLFKDYDVVREWVKSSEVVKPNPKNREVYDRLYRAYLEALSRLTDVFKGFSS
ncbi:MAG: FGGY-family carbohydrate kinase [Candidatus Bathyarchaeia archaeon]